MQTQSEKEKISCQAGNARMQTLGQLLKTTIPAFISPVPCNVTIRSWFNQAGVRRFKPNPTAKRGGGPVYYMVGDVEKFLRSRMLPGRLAPSDITMRAE